MKEIGGLLKVGHSFLGTERARPTNDYHDKD